jgi:hypothetical protein
MELKLTYESELDAWTLTHKEVRVTSPANVNTWRRLLARQFEKLGGRRSWILIDMADFELAPSVAELYGATAKAPGAEHALGIVRYGRPATVTTTGSSARHERFPYESDYSIAAVAGPDFYYC